MFNHCFALNNRVLPSTSGKNHSANSIPPDRGVQVLEVLRRLMPGQFTVNDRLRVLRSSN